MGEAASISGCGLFSATRGRGREQGCGGRGSRSWPHARAKGCIPHATCLFSSIWRRPWCTTGSKLGYWGRKIWDGLAPDGDAAIREPAMRVDHIAIDVNTDLERHCYHAKQARGREIPKTVPMYSLAQGFSTLYCNESGDPSQLCWWSSATYTKRERYVLCIICGNSTISSGCEEPFMA